MKALSLTLIKFFFSDFQLFGLSTTDETSLVEMRTWCIKIGIVLVLHSKDMAKVKVFEKWVKLQGQSQKVKTFGTNRKVLS
jgi:hypothetical protein